MAKTRLVLPLLILAIPLALLCVLSGCGSGDETATSVAAPPSTESPGQTQVSTPTSPRPGPPSTKPAGPPSTSTGTEEPATASDPAYEPPINVFVVLHIDPIGELGAETFRPEPGMYLRTRDEIDWLEAEAAEHDLHLSVLYNGWYPKWALDHDELDQFRDLLAAGHEIGSHTHQITYDPQTDTWVSHHEELGVYGRPNYDPELARRAWSDASDCIETLLDTIGAEGQNQIMCSTALSLSDERDLMREFGFTIASGNRLEASSNYLGHMSWNPWRASNSDEPGYEVAEDMSAPYVSVNHAAQIGTAESHSTYSTVDQLQRQFLQLYAEWLARERNGAEDRVWSFGFVYHPNQGDKYNADLTQFLDWLDTYFIGKESPGGNTIARYATISEIVGEFRAWEAAHPGVSSFNYVRGDPYPYSYANLASVLTGAGYEDRVDVAAGVSCFRLSKDGETLYLLWSDEGPKTIDLSALCEGQPGGQVLITDESALERPADAAALALTEEPMLIRVATGAAH